MKHIDPGSLRLEVVLDLAGPQGDNSSTIENEFGQKTPLIEVLGLDQRNNNNPGDRTPDGYVDAEYIDYEKGLLWFPDLRPLDPSLADIEGTAYRARSWPLAPGASRPDTLGWTLDQATGMAVPSSAGVRDRETIPEIYDLLPSELSRTSGDIHIYSIEVVAAQ
jgi:hypothetical protein